MVGCSSMWFDKQKRMESIIDDFFGSKVFLVHDDLSKYIYKSIGSGSFENVVKRSLKDDLVKLSQSDDQFRDEVPYISGKCYVDRFLMLYLLLRGFHHQKDNFDNFKVIVDDLKEYRATYMYFDISDFTTVMDTIELILSNKDYKDLFNTRSYLNKLYEEIGSISFDAFSFVKDYEKCLKIYEDGKSLNCDSVVVANVFDSMIGNLLKNNKPDFYYSKILLFGNRYNYFNDNLYRVEDNSFIREQIFNFLDKFSIDMFNELNELNVDSDKDSFIASMGCVFDSDTYYEMNSKLNLMKNASLEYENDNKKKAFQLIKEISSESHKEKIDGKMVSYPTNCINQVEKPKRIIDRMKELYPKFDDSILYDFLDQVHERATSLSEINEDVLYYRNSFFNKVKKVVKTSFKKKD